MRASCAVGAVFVYKFDGWCADWGCTEPDQAQCEAAAELMPERTYLHASVGSYSGYTSGCYDSGSSYVIYNTDTGQSCGTDTYGGNARPCVCECGRPAAHTRRRAAHVHTGAHARHAHSPSLHVRLCR